MNGAYNTTDGQEGRWTYRDCSDGSRDLVWVPDGQPAQPGEPAEIDLQALADSVEITPTVPTVQTSPPGFTLVNLETWFWVDPGQWQPVAGDATAGTVTVTVTAQPRALVVDPGDGSAPVTCPDGGTAYDQSQAPEAQHSDCTHVYSESSWRSPDEHTHGTVTVTYDVTWSSSLGPGGTLGTITPDPVPFSIQVLEAQAVNTNPPT